VNYETSDDAQLKSFEQLLITADDVVGTYPDQADPLIWRGIIKSSYAGAKGGLGALSLAKSAKKDFEQALAIDDKALMGSAYTSLGTLYFKVPGWPLGFGDDEQAETLLKKALALNPNGIDSNYFYGLFLLEENNLALAEQFLLKAKNAPKRPDRPVADKGRLKEIQIALQQLEQKRNTNKYADSFN
jgi:Tfp pilus assembly protein PilF